MHCSWMSRSDLFCKEYKVVWLVPCAIICLSGATWQAGKIGPRLAFPHRTISCLGKTSLYTQAQIRARGNDLLTRSITGDAVMPFAESRSFLRMEIRSEDISCIVKAHLEAFSMGCVFFFFGRPHRLYIAAKTLTNSNHPSAIELTASKWVVFFVARWCSRPRPSQGLLISEKRGGNLIEIAWSYLHISYTLNDPESRQEMKPSITTNA